MRTKDGPVRVLTPLACALILMTLCAGCSSNSTERQLQTCTAIGAGVGALAGASGGLFLRIQTRGNHRSIGDIEKDNLLAWSAAGGGIGLLLGAAVGRAVCSPNEEPSSVTFYTPRSSSISSASSYNVADGTPSQANP